MPRHTHPRTVASIKPPGTQILRKTKEGDLKTKDYNFASLLLDRRVVNRRNAVEQKKGHKDSRLFQPSFKLRNTFMEILNLQYGQINSRSM